VYYFVYQRGEDQSRREAIFHYLKGNNTRIDDEWISSWHLIHNSVLKEMVMRLDKYVKAWVAAPAGVVFDAELRKQKYILSCRTVLIVLEPLEKLSLSFQRMGFFIITRKAIRRITKACPLILTK
jgi:hypothetical protein